MSEAGHIRRPRFVTRRSPVHGRGLFANKAIYAREFICEYRGARVSCGDVLSRLPDGHTEPGHTFFFDLEEVVVIDGSNGGSSARWINHACTPIREAELSGSRIFVYALHDISPGEELTLDYALLVDRRHNQNVREQFRCYCLSPECRGTILEERQKKLREDPLRALREKKAPGKVTAPAGQQVIGTHCVG